MMADIEGPAIARYNAKLDDYYRDVELYVRKLHKFQTLLRRALLMELEIVNDGTIPADEINLILRVPSILNAVSERLLSSGPQKPKPPDPPERFQELFRAPSPLHGFDPSALGNLSPRNVSKPRILNDRRTVSVEIRRLRHGLPESLEPFCLVFSSWEKAASFGIDYEIRSATLPRATTGRVHVIIDGPDGESAKSDDTERRG